MLPPPPAQITIVRHMPIAIAAILQRMATRETDTIRRLLPHLQSGVTKTTLMTPTPAPHAPTTLTTDAEGANTPTILIPTIAIAIGIAIGNAAAGRDEAREIEI